MEYDKKKDKTPEETVLNIRSILKKIGIDELEEILFTRKTNEHCTESIRIHLKEDFFCGTNGKGTNYEYARASAYGEFIERIQYPYIIRYLPPDNKKQSIKDFLKSDVLRYFLDKKSLLDKAEIKKSINLASEFETSNYRKCIDTIPYNHINTNKIVYLPQNLRWYTSISTGTSSGNTIYEALIEGFCEIFERYVQTRVVLEPIALPDIPEDIYIKYDSIKIIVEYVKKLGFKIQVKDASLDGKYPVICTVISSDKYGYYACFGSHPYLPIAIERCLTETMQGFDISDESRIKDLFKDLRTKENTIKYAKYDNALWHRYIELNAEFFTKNSEYIFKEEYWSNAENSSNKELFHKLLNGLLSKNIDVFIRDLNFLGVPAFQVYIPDLMSCFKIIDDDYGKSLKYDNYKCDRIFKRNLKINVTEKEVTDFFIYMFHLKTKYSHNNYKNLELYYVILLITKGEYEKALNILNTMSKMGKFSRNRHLVNFFIEYLNLKIAKHLDLKIKKILSKKYSSFVIKKILDGFFKTNGLKSIIKIMKSRQIYADKKNELGILKKRELSEKLLIEYRKNLPTQEHIKDKII